MSEKGKSVITKETKAILLSNIQKKIAQEEFFFTENDVEVEEKDIKKDILMLGKTEYGIGGSKVGMQYTLRFGSSQNDIRDGKRKVVFMLIGKNRQNLDQKIDKLQKTQKDFEGISGQAMRNEILALRKKKVDGNFEAKKLQKLINEIGAVYALLW